jgi:bifunctional N-acetylglucosamine-1-phosphate-uridyltransferase/glucosamine-1-phosphate-acetyltransferase GlmU-like protein
MMLSAEQRASGRRSATSSGVSKYMRSVDAAVAIGAKSMLVGPPQIERRVSFA